MFHSGSTPNGQNGDKVINPSPVWSLARFLFKLLIRLFGVVVLIMGLGVIFLTQLDIGRELLARTISTLASSPDQQITIRKIDGLLAGGLRVGRVTIADSKGAWLRVSDIALDWHPMALFKLRFDGDSLNAGEINLIRTPVAETARETQPTASSSVSLPVSLNLKSIEIKKITIDRQVVNDPIALRLSGQDFAVDSGLSDLSAKFVLERIDGIKSYFNGQFMFSRSTSALRLNASLHEPAGSGTIGYLLGIAERPEIDLRLSTYGSLADLGIKIDGQLGGQQLIAAQGRFNYDQQTWKIKGDAKTKPGLLPILDRLKHLLGSTTILTIDAQGVGADHAVINQFKIANNNLLIEAAGTVASGDQASDLNAKIMLKPDGEQFDFSGGDGQKLLFGTMAVNARLTGSLTNAKWRLNANIAKADVGVLSATNFDLVASGDKGNLIDLNLPFDFGLSSETSASTDLLKMLEGKLKVNATGRFSRQALTIDRLTAGNSALNLQADGNYALASGGFTFNASGAIKSKSLPVALAARLVREVKFSVATGGNIERQDITVGRLIAYDDGNVKLNVNATLEEGAKLSGDVAVTVARLNPIETSLTGSLNLDGQVSGTLAKPRLNIQAKGDKLTLRDVPIEQAKLTFDGLLSISPLEGLLELRALVKKVPLVGEIKLSTDDRGIRKVERIYLNFADARLDGAFTIPTDAPPIGSLQLNVPDLAKLNPLLPAPARGRIKLTAGFANETASENANSGVLRIDAQANDLAFNQVNANGVVVQAALPMPFGDLRLSSKLKIDQIIAGGIKVGQTVLSTTPDSNNQLQVNLASLVDGEPVKLQATVTRSDNQTTIRLVKGSGVWRGQSMRIANPTLITLDPAGIRIDDFKLAINDGLIGVNGLLGDQSAMVLKITGLSAAIAEAVAPDLGASGIISGQANVSGKLANLEADFNFKLQNGSMVMLKSAGIAGVNLIAKGNLRNNKLVVNAGLTNPTGLKITADGTLALDSSPLDLALNVDGKIPLALGGAILAEHNLRADGIVRVNASVTGKITSPNIAGAVKLDGGRLIQTDNGFSVKNIKINIRLADGRAYIEQMRARLGPGGNVTANGVVGIPGLAPGNVDLKVKARNAMYNYGEIATVLIGGDLALKGNLPDMLALTGRVNLGKVNLEIPATFPASVSLLKVRHRNAPSQVTRIKSAEPVNKTTKQASSPITLVMDVAVNAPGQLFINGRGLSAEFGGNLRLKGALTKIVAVGQFSPKSGKLLLLGKSFALDPNSTITFDGSLEPSIYLQITREVSGNSYSIQITGKVSSPKISFVSQPQLPQDEILAQMLFGRSISSLSVFQIAQIADSIVTLTGGSGSANVINRLRAGIGLDDLSVSVDEKGRTSVTAGKYISEKIYLNVVESSDPEVQGANVDIDITKGLKARIGAKGGGEVIGSAFYEYEY